MWGLVRWMPRPHLLPLLAQSSSCGQPILQVFFPPLSRRGSSLPRDTCQGRGGVPHPSVVRRATSRSNPALPRAARHGRRCARGTVCVGVVGWYGVVRGDPRKDCLAINYSAVTSQTLLSSWQVSCRWRQSQPTPPARVHLGVLRVGGRSGRLVARSPAGHSHPLPRAHRGCAAEAPASRYHPRRRLRPRRWLCISCSQPAPPRPSLILSVVPAGHNVGPCHSCLLAALPTGDPVERTARPALCGPFTPFRWPLLRDCSHWSLWDRLGRMGEVLKNVLLPPHGATP